MMTNDNLRRPSKRAVEYQNIQIEKDSSKSFKLPVLIKMLLATQNIFGQYVLHIYMVDWKS